MTDILLIVLIIAQAAGMIEIWWLHKNPTAPSDEYHIKTVKNQMDEVDLRHIRNRQVMLKMTKID